MKIKFIVFSLLFLFCIKVHAEPSPEGTWKVSGKDDENIFWRAKLFLKSDDKDNYPPKKFKGYFDWEGSNGLKGREYIVLGVFDYETRVLKLAGTELEDAHPGIKTSLYTVLMDKDAEKLQDGMWRSCGVVPGVWEATRLVEREDTKPKKGKGVRRVDVARENCLDGQCPLERN